ncbi:alpha-glucuronidase [Kribbella sp. VKM Ac-2571]|uniref:alpha-glucuronidase n=1 Tax=Kribbella sp. VKM Ac-2571 TaxID=2512222 RepID=UPI00105E4D63|nr:alpha-glucuronidase [Kribbella sp. VKM Ac-2571]TDO68100.1 alpha-glucuronidase [Kribbella sp. VKM Ac-2571]
MTADSAWLGTQRLPEVTVHASGVLAQTIRAEVRQTRRFRTDVQIAVCTLTRVRETALWQEVEAAVPEHGLGVEGFVVVRRGNDLVVAAEGGHGLLYGYFYVLRYFEWMSGDFTVVEQPAVPIRMLDHWDELSGVVRRGYSGGSIFFRDGAVVPDLTRVRAYARLLASIGINAVALATAELPDVARLAGVFREYGIALSLAVDFVDDPRDERVARWWAATVARVYDVVPDLGGLVVRTARDPEGANLLARAVAPYGGSVFWRCSGAEPEQDWRDRRADRARAAYDAFIPLDGRFEENVVLQVKHGPLDFQIREPVAPLLGEFQETVFGVELQVTQEYSGQQQDLCYLGPWWREILQFDTTGGGGVTVADRIGAIVAVSNVGDDPNWTGHKLAQSNLYAFGRLAWDPAADPVSLLHEWAAATFAMDDRTRSELVTILSGSWQTYERYTAPLGVGFMVTPGTHYGPSVNGYEYSGAGRYHFADRYGVGVDRTVKTGSGFTGQYPEPLASLYEDMYTCPDELLLFFHHVPYDHVLQSGSTVLQHIYDTHFQGYAEVEAMVARWQVIAERFEPAVRANITARFETQLSNAREWRDQVNTFFYRLSGVPDAHGRTIHR